MAGCLLQQELENNLNCSGNDLSWNASSEIDLNWDGTEISNGSELSKF